MKLLKQIKIEIKNILRSKFLLIIGLILIAGSFAPPIINAVSDNSRNNGNWRMDGPVYMEAVSIDYGYKDSGPVYFDGESEETITVNGVTITGDNPFFWSIRGIVDEKDYMSRESKMFSSPESLDLMLELMDDQLAHYLRLAQVITTNQDYRADIGWQADQYIVDIFVYEHNEVNTEALIEAMQFRMGLDEEQFKEKYINITAEERLKALDAVESKLNRLYDTIERNDFAQYVAIRIEQETDNIDQMLEQIALHEQTIIDNPAQEEHLSMIIEDVQREIERIQTNRIPIWEYRLAKNIIPRDGSWQNTALSDIEYNRDNLTYKTIMSEEEFNKERYMTEQYGSYAKYKRTIQAEIDEANENILIAQHSLDADKPDMKYVQEGARNKTVGFLDYSVFIALFSVLIGGWLIAREFSQGTIRLLMIRPKTRTTILLSKFFAALIICLAMYTAGCLLNLFANGIFNGFADFANPNFTASGEVGFFAYYFPKFLACSVTVILGYTFAFMLSSVTKNIAVSIIIPVVCFIGSYIGMNILANSRMMSWVAYTPLPYVQISSFFSEWSAVSRFISRGAPISLTYGIIMLLAFSAVFTVISIWVFKKRDITN